MADETGIVLPWEKDAMAGLEMPDGLSYPDQILYMELPNGQIARATVYDSGTSDFDSDFKFDVNDLVATDWEFV